MNGLYSVYIYSLLIIFTFSNCKQDDEVLNDFEGEEYITATIDDDFLSINKRQGSINASKFIDNSGLINLKISGTTAQGESIELWIADYAGPATYFVGDNFSNNNQVKYWSLAKEWVQSFEGEDGNPNKIVITKDGGNHVVGTFNFEGHNMDDGSVKLIKEGKFQVGIVPL